MKSLLKWTEGMKFEAQSESNKVSMDAKSPIGTGTAMTPKELVAAGLGGCTAMDVIALLKKHKQAYQTLEVDVDIAVSTGTLPVVFTHAALTFRATGEIDPQVLMNSVQLSQTKYCGVSAMLVKAFPIDYQVLLNGTKIGEGKTDFSADPKKF